MTEQFLTLFGDSILDNALYTSTEPDTTAHLERLLGKDWVIQRMAKDGARIRDVYDQLLGLSNRASISVLSVGGNDMRTQVGILEQPTFNSGMVFEQLDEIGIAFQKQYEKVVKAVAAKSKRLIVCTIYEVRLEPPVFAKRVRVPLSVLNDWIIRTAVKLGVDVLDLRSVCTEAADFVLEIEPSAQGAAKIAKAIADIIQDDNSLSSGRVFAT